MHCISHLSVWVAVLVIASPLSAFGMGVRGASINQVQVATLTLPGMPITIDSAMLENVDGKNLLRYRVTNLGHDRVNRVQMEAISYAMDGDTRTQFSLDDCKLAPGASIESSEPINRDLSQVTRMLFLAVLAQGDGNAWFIDGADAYRFQKDIIDVGAYSRPDVRCCPVTWKALPPEIAVIRPAGDVEPPQSSRNGVTETRPIPLDNPRPLYTAEARKNNVQGVVKLQVLVGVDGAVIKAMVISGLPDGLNEEAIACAYKIRFQPATKDGQPVAFWQGVHIEFNLR